MTETERAALEIEGKVWARGAIGAKDQACYDIGLTPIRHAQIVAELCRRPDVVAEEPVLCARLVRLQDARRAVRSARTLE